MVANQIALLLLGILALEMCAQKFVEMASNGVQLDAMMGII